SRSGTNDDPRDWTSKSVCAWRVCISQVPRAQHLFSSCHNERAARVSRRPRESRYAGPVATQSLPNRATLTPVLSRADHLFPTLTKEQIERVAAHGETRRVRAGEVLIEPGAPNVPFFVVVSGQLEAVRSGAPSGEVIVVAPTAGQFTGEATMISGRRALFLIRAREDGEVLQLTREEVAALVQNDAELSEILIRAFVLRRVELIAANVGDTAIVGSTHSADTLRIKEFL